MAFENLGDRYNSGFGKEIDDNLDRGGDRRRRQQTPPTPPSTNESPVNYKPFSRLAEKISDGNPQTTDYSISKEYQTFYGGGTILTGPLATGVHSGTDVYNQDKIKVRNVNLNELGTAGRLGSGDYVLESLYLKTHKNNPNRQPIDTGRVDENGNAILINTTRAGMGNLNGLDIKGYSTDEILYRGSNRGNEPYQISEINSEYKDPFPNSTLRMLEFYRSDAGKALVIRENITDYLSKNVPKVDLKRLTFRRAGAAIGEALGGSVSGFIEGTIRKSFIPGHNALLVNLLKNRITFDIKDRELFNIGGQSVDLNQALGSIGATPNDLLGEFGKRFDINYSARIRAGAPFGQLGDKPYNLSYLNKIKKVSEEGQGPFPKLNAYFRRQQNKLRKFGEEQSQRIEDAKQNKVTPFMDLSGPGNHSDSLAKFIAGKAPRAHGYDDKISNSGVEDIFFEDASNAPLEDETFDIQDGDFYVRFKDLRDNAFIYFRGYINGITENLSPSWSPTEYVGRSEPVYMYQRAERDISFNLAVYPQNGSEERYMYTKLNKLTSMVYPEYVDDNRLSGVQRMKPPFTEMFMAHIGTKERGQFGYIKSLSYTVNESGDWNALELLPRVFNIAISYQIVSKRPPSLKSGFYRPLPEGNKELTN